ncbi:MAG TPA: carbohydrate ABC transporter permease, partial [bacterium]|nr:carbohydrate ABC transporter permease [bacterium]
MISKTARYLITMLLSLYALVVVYPLFWMIATSLKDSWSIFAEPWRLFGSVHLVNYTNAWLKGALGWKFWNSLIIDTLSLVFILLLSAMVAYVLARFRFPGNRFLYYLFLLGMALPVFLGIVPLFILMKNLGLLDTRIGLATVYCAYSLSFTIFVLHGFFRTLPAELAEAAVMDGCSPFGVFWKVMLPLA